MWPPGAAGRGRQSQVSSGSAGLVGAFDGDTDVGGLLGERRQLTLSFFNCRRATFRRGAWAACDAHRVVGRAGE